MKRMVLIANPSIENEIINALEEKIIEFNYNIFPQKHGKGKSRYRLEKTTSYEMEFFLVSYLYDENAVKARKAIYKVREHFPREVIKLYFIDTQKSSISFKKYKKQNNLQQINENT